MEKIPLVLITLLLAGLTLNACQVVAEETLQATSTEPTPTSLPTSQDATLPPAETEVAIPDHTTVEDARITFNLPIEVAKGASVSTLAHDDPSDGWPEFELPERRLVSFTGYAIENHFHTPGIYVIPLEATDQFGDYGLETITLLKNLLDNPNIELSAQEDLPFLPPFNAAQVFHALEKRLESENGSGIRYITLYSQGIVGVDNFDVFYTYQGLTADEKYYIAAVLPINSSLLSDSQFSNDDMERIAENYLAYIAEMTDLLRTNEGGVMAPSLEALDAMMTSLFILQP